MEMEIGLVEGTAGPVAVAAMDSSGIVNWRVTGVPEPNEMDCSAAKLTSTVAPAEAVLAVTKPCSIAGEVAPVSATRGMALRLVPFGTFTTAVAL